MDRCAIVLYIFKFTAITRATAQCSKVGTDGNSFSGYFKEWDGLFLNIGSPSQCSGTVVSWHFHYELDGCRYSKSKYRHGIFLVYRPVSNHSYEVVPGSVKEVTVPCQDDDGIQSWEEMLPLSEQFTVQKGDIIAACLPYNKRIRMEPLQILEYGKDIRVNNIHEYYDAGGDIDDCRINRLQTVITRDIRSRRYYQLHLYAEIAGI